jgi:ABC-type transporter lipoprotein component MlaA
MAGGAAYVILAGEVRYSLHFLNRREYTDKQGNHKKSQAHDNYKMFNRKMFGSNLMSDFQRASFKIVLRHCRAVLFS